MSRRTCLLLVTSTPLTSACEQKQRKVAHWLSAYRCAFKRLDGGVESHKAMRENLFTVSGIRGNYPQLFLVGTDAVEFVGGFDTLETMIEAETLPPSVLNAHPEITTFTQACAQHCRPLGANRSVGNELADRTLGPA